MKSLQFRIWVRIMLLVAALVSICTGIHVQDGFFVFVGVIFFAFSFSRYGFNDDGLRLIFFNVKMPISSWYGMNIAFKDGTYDGGVLASKSTRLQLALWSTILFTKRDYRLACGYFYEYAGNKATWDPWTRECCKNISIENAKSFMKG